MLKIVEFELNDKDLIGSVVFEHRRKLIFPNWGFELGNWYSFFSFEKRGGLHSELNLFDLKRTDNELVYSGSVSLKENKLDFKYSEMISNSQIKRSISVSPVCDMYLGDLAIRFSLRNEKQLKINDSEVFPRKRNNLYNTLIKPIFVEYDSIMSKIEGTDTVDGFDLAPYYRFERPDLWIIHYRIVNNTQDQGVLKIIKPELNFIDPSFLDRRSRQYLLYRRERKSTRSMMQLCYNKFIKKGTNIFLEMTMEFSEKGI